MIQVSRLSKAYGEQRVLKNLSFSIAPKGIHGILGPKGSGKTTLMDVLAGCEIADEGTIRLDGQNFDVNKDEQKARIGYVVEQPCFYEAMTAMEILEFVGEARGVSVDKRYRQIKEALELTDIEAVQNRLISHLTKEERKRLALAVALLGNTEVLLWDEPMQGILAERKQEWLSLIRMLGKHKTVVLASRDFSLIRELCEDVIILSEGAVLAQDTFEGLESKLLRNRALRLSTKGEADSVLETLRTINGVSHCVAEPSKQAGEIKVRIEYQSDCEIREALSAALKEIGAPILSMTEETLSLEGVYASLVAISERPITSVVNGRKEKT